MMDKLQMCRICLAENVRMYVVVNNNLHDVYEKLTDIPFVTEDSRPILACFICSAQLKKCYQFQKKCLEAEEQFAQITKEEYKPKPLNQDYLELFHGLIRTPIDTINIVDVDQTESIVVKEELPAVCERLDDIIEPKEEHESDDDIKTVNIYDNYLDIEVSPLHHSTTNKPDPEDDLIEVEIEVEDDQNMSKIIQNAIKPINTRKTKPDDFQTYLCKKREEYLKKGELKRRARTSTERSRDYRERKKKAILLQKSKAASNALSNLGVSDLQVPSLPLGPTPSTSAATLCNTSPTEIHTPLSEV